MSESDFVKAVHTLTGVIGDVPRHYVETGQFTALSAEEVIELQRKAELEMFGEYKTPAPKPKAVAKPAEAPTKPVKAPTEEGDK